MKYSIAHLMIIFLINNNTSIKCQDREIIFIKKEINYTAEESFPLRDSTNSNSSSIDKVINSLLFIYSKTISEHDGDNCPFHPSCSSFFLDAVQKTDLISGTLLFADRFTRDTNPIKSSRKHFLLPNGKLYDPVKKYLLKSERFIFSPDD
ncbi:MAG TPA: membrane protein insertion efficiency factor YidD [Ignavibacteriaceae bacterium]|nr:membrane protein insertion efficiency factor YidD [Ignavibacteriaceae bacterium]